MTSTAEAMIVDDSTNATAVDDDPYDAELSWADIPSELLENIYTHMTYCERLNVSSVCRKWRNSLFCPRLWWDVNLYINTKREGKKAFFLCKVIHFAKNLVIHWPAVYSRGRVQRPKGVELHNKETLKALFQAMKSCVNLRTLILKLENPCAFSTDFSAPARECLEVVCRQNKSLVSVSFGCNIAVIPANVMEVLPDEAKTGMRQFHVGVVRVEADSGLGWSGCGEFPTLTDQNDFMVLGKFHSLRVLTIDWSNVSSGLIQGLASGSTLEKLNVLVAAHHCNASSHPTLDDWEQFASANNRVNVSLTFVKKFAGLCDSLGLIRPEVHMVKILECSHVDSDEFGKLVKWYKDSVDTMAFVGVWDSIELDTGPSILSSISNCFRLRHLTVLGYFVLDDILLFIATLFQLKTFNVSKAHILMLAEATHYLLPTSSAKYNEFRQEISAILGRPWEALSQINLEGFYFAEGDDDKLYT